MHGKFFLQGDTVSVGTSYCISQIALLGVHAFVLCRNQIKCVDKILFLCLLSSYCVLTFCQSVWSHHYDILCMHLKNKDCYSLCACWYMCTNITMHSFSVYCVRRYINNYSSILSMCTVYKLTISLLKADPCGLQYVIPCCFISMIQVV